MPGPVAAGTCAFEITVRGHGCHAAMPHQGVDTIVAASQLVQALQTVVARNLHPATPRWSASRSSTRAAPGTSFPRKRCCAAHPQLQAGSAGETVERAIERLCSGVASANGAQIGVVFDHRYPATVNSSAETEICRKVAATTLGEDKVRKDELPSMGAGDFAYMLREARLLRVAGQRPGTGGCTLHNPHYDFNDGIIALGVRYWVNLVAQTLARP